MSVIILDRGSVFSFQHSFFAFPSTYLNKQASKQTNEQTNKQKLHDKSQSFSISYRALKWKYNFQLDRQSKRFHRGERTKNTEFILGCYV